MAITKVSRDLLNTSIVDNGNATAITIDSSERVIVGNASPFTADSVTIDQGGFLAIRNTSGSGMEVRRDSTDGSLIDFQKDGSPVGSIGTGGALIGIGAGTGNLGFFDATIVPMSNTSGGGSDNIINLGNTGRAFKDLYLSGGVYLGGTVAANKLDDYEEGTWTGTLKGETEPGTLITATGLYTKIGRMVNYTLAYENIDTSGYAGAISVAGLPFTNNGTRSAGAIGTYYMATWNTATELYTLIEVSQTTITLQSARSSDTWAQPTHVGASQGFMWLQGTYITNS